MKRIIIALSAVLLATLQVSAWATSHNTKNKPLPFKNQTERLSYTIGADMGLNFKKQAIDVDSQLLMQGIQDALAGKELKMTKPQMEETLRTFQKSLVEKREAKFKQESSSNLKAADKFFAKNKKEKNVVTLPSGLQYRIIKAGKGQSPADKDTVTVNYTGRLLNGEVFDSSERVGKPVQFQVDQVIPGWSEALKLMKPGSTWELFIPPKLAYGERGLGGPIGPNSALIFRVDLVSFEKAKADKKS